MPGKPIADGPASAERRRIGEGRGSGAAPADRSGSGLSPAVLAVFAVLFLLHAVLLFLVVPRAKVAFPYLNIDTFSDFYDTLATSLVAGRGYRFFADTAPTMSRAPAYPLLLAGLFLLFGRSLAAAKALNLLLAFGTALLIRRLSLRLSVRLPERETRLVALLAPVLYLLHPFVLIAETRGGVEVLFGFCLALAALLFVRARESGRVRDHLWAGLALGAGALVKSTTLLFPILWGLTLLFRRGSRRRARILLPSWIALCSGLALALAPWVARNYALTGRFVPTMTVVGMSATQGLEIGRTADLRHPFAPSNGFGGGMNRGARETVRLAAERGIPTTGDYFLFFRSPLDELEFNSYLTDRVRRAYQHSPALALKCLLVNSVGFWIGGVTVKVCLLNALVALPFLGLAAAGAVRFRRRRALGPPAGPVLLCTLLLLLCFLAVHVPILAVARHSLPLVPLLAVWAAVPPAALLGRRRAGRSALVETGHDM